MSFKIKLLWKKEFSLIRAHTSIKPNYLLLCQSQQLSKINPNKVCLFGQLDESVAAAAERQAPAPAEHVVVVIEVGSLFSGRSIISQIFLNARCDRSWWIRSNYCSGRGGWCSRRWPCSSYSCCCGWISFCWSCQKNLFWTWCWWPPSSINNHYRTHTNCRESRTPINLISQNSFDF